MPALTYSVSDFQPFTKIRSADVNSKFSSIQTLLNTTKLDDDNIQNTGITGSTKLKLLSVTGAVVANETIADTKISTTSSIKFGSPLLGDGSTGADFLGPLVVPGMTWNVGFTYSAGTFKVTQANGSVFSTGSSGGIIALPSATVGQYELKQLTSDIYKFNDDSFAGTSDIAGAEFGCDTGVAWGEDRPFFLYACNTASNGAQFFISPDPSKTVTPNNANKQGYAQNTTNINEDDDIFWLSTTDLTANTSKPCVLIGGFRMQMSASDDWTVQTLDLGQGDGLSSRPFHNMWFVMPTGQHASSGKYFGNNGGTAPTFANNDYYYRHVGGGVVELHVAMSGNTAIDGAGSVAVKMALPFAGKNMSPTVDAVYMSGMASVVYAATTSRVTYFTIASASPTQANFVEVTSATAQSAMTYASFTDAARQITANMFYTAFGTINS